MCPLNLPTLFFDSIVDYGRFGTSSYLGDRDKETLDPHQGPLEKARNLHGCAGVEDGTARGTLAGAERQSA